MKATDARSLLLLPPLPRRPAIVLLSVERCPPTTHDLGPGLATGIESGALFFLHGRISREEEDYYLHLGSPLLASGPKSSRRDPLPISSSRPMFARGEPFFLLLSNVFTRGYFYFFARKKRFERFERVEGEIGEGSVKERRRRSPPRIDA